MQSGKSFTVHTVEQDFWSLKRLFLHKEVTGYLATEVNGDIVGFL